MSRVVITGAYGAIGSAIVKGMAGIMDNEYRAETKSVLTAKHEVWMLGRDRKKLEWLRNEIYNSYPHADLHVHSLDLAERREISLFASSFEGGCDVLINCTASAPRERMENSEGIETQFAVNVLSYYRLSLALLLSLKKSVDPRIVNVASNWAGDFDVNDLEFKRRSYDNRTAYRQTKQAIRMMTTAMSRDILFRGVCINSCHPGGVIGHLANDLNVGGSESAEYGAKTPLYLSLSENVRGLTGFYFEGCEPREDELCRDLIQVEELMKKIRGYN